MPASWTAFLSSGFEPVTRTPPSAPQPLPQPTVDKVDQGITGQMLAILKPAPKARIHELEYTLFDGGIPGAWTTITVARANKTIPIDGLTPGKTYAFRVRAFGELGHTDWSDLVTRMCI